MNKQFETVLLTLQEACDFLKIKKSRLRTAIFRKEIPYIKIGRLIRFDLQDLQSWLNRLKTSSS